MPGRTPASPRERHAVFQDAYAAAGAVVRPPGGDAVTGTGASSPRGRFLRHASTSCAAGGRRPDRGAGPDHARPRAAAAGCCGDSVGVDRRHRAGDRRASGRGARACASWPGTAWASTRSTSTRPRRPAGSSSRTPPERTARRSPTSPSALLLARSAASPAGDRRVRRGDWSVSRGRELAGSLTVGGGRLRPDRPRRSRDGCRVRRHGCSRTTRRVDDAWSPTAGSRRARGDLRHRCDGRLPARARRRAPWSTPPGWPACRADHGSGQHRPRRPRRRAGRSPARCATGRLGAYAADTLAAEAGGDSASPLLAVDLADRVLVTPHLGAQTGRPSTGWGPRRRRRPRRASPGPSRRIPFCRRAEGEDCVVRL